jgi:hypothetical protein
VPVIKSCPSKTTILLKKMSYYLNEEQENLFSPSNSINSRGNGRGTGAASAKAWEESLDDVVSQSDENIEKFNDMQRLKPRSTLQPSKNTPLTVGTNKARSASTSRSSTPMTQQNRESFDPAATIERKVDFLFRRTKLLDEKLRFAEKEKLEIRSFSQVCSRL